jgi:periplasmic divalent cation tolerance protein
LIIFSTVPNRRAAGTIARTLVKERLAACVNIIPGLESHYHWEGKQEKTRELLLVIKSTRAAYARLERRLKALHPYTVPEILAVPILRGSAAYLQWLNASVRP